MCCYERNIDTFVINDNILKTCFDNHEMSAIMQCIPKKVFTSLCRFIRCIWMIHTHLYVCNFMFFLSDSFLMYSLVTCDCLLTLWSDCCLCNIIAIFIPNLIEYAMYLFFFHNNKY